MARTGLSDVDARDDFQRARRRAVLADLHRRLRGEPDDVALILPFEEVVEALGRVGEQDLGLQVVDIDTIVGTVDRTREFDRGFRPISGRVRGRWERIAAAARRGEPLPPVSLYRVSGLHFVRDGHHRVSVARTLGWRKIDAYVTEVRTRVGLDRDLRLSDLPLKSHERLFHERVPLPGEQRKRLVLSDPWDYARLAEGVEAWGFRLMQQRGEFVDRPTVAALWFEEEYAPVSAMLREAGLVGRGETEADAYLRVASLRYRLLRTHEWSEDVIERLRGSSKSSR